MNEIEIHFGKDGNTIIGNHAGYVSLDLAMENKHVPTPYGYCIKGEPADIKRLTEYVKLFGNCIVNFRGWRKACELAGVAFTKIV